MPRAFITGIAGQDGSYLAEFLIEKGYEVHGLVRSPMTMEKSWLTGLEKACGSKLFLHNGNTNDLNVFPALIEQTKPDEVYHLAGHTHVLESFNDPEGALELNARATVRLLETARRMAPKPRIFHASSAEIFGAPAQSPQDENTPVVPLNPYACAKAFSGHMLAVYRKTYGLFASNGILYSHESPRRGEQFMTRKVCSAAAAIKLGRAEELKLGDLRHCATGLMREMSFKACGSHYSTRCRRILFLPAVNCTVSRNSSRPLLPKWGLIGVGMSGPIQITSGRLIHGGCLAMQEKRNTCSDGNLAADSPISSGK